MTKMNEVEAIRQRRMDSLRRDLAEMEELLEEKQAELHPIEEEVKRLRIMLRDYTSGSMGSGQISDDQIVSWLKKNSSEGSPLHTPDIAAGFGGDGRGFSRRLPRMARAGLIQGDSENGYWVGARTRVRANA